MDLPEIQDRFEQVVAEFVRATEKRGYQQNTVICNEYGVFIDFNGVGVNYSLYSLEDKDNLENYLIQQTEKHHIYGRLLYQHKVQTKKALEKQSSPIHNFLSKFSRAPKESLEQRIDAQTVRIIFDQVLKEGGLLGNYFFREIARDYTKYSKKKGEELRIMLVHWTETIYKNAEELETLDKEILTRLEKLKVRK